jgi:hypothetical protein
MKSGMRQKFNQRIPSRGLTVFRSERPKGDDSKCGQTVSCFAGKHIPEFSSPDTNPSILNALVVQKTGFTGDFRSESMLRSREIAASVKVAISVALIPRTIIAHSSYDIIVMLHDEPIFSALSVAYEFQVQFVFFQ